MTQKPSSALAALRAAIPAKPAKSLSLLKGKPKAGNSFGLMTEKQAADHLGVSIYTLQRIRKRGEIAFSKVGSGIRYTFQQLEDFSKNCEQSCSPNVSKSVTSGSPSVQVPKTITPHGSTKGPDKQTAALLAQQTFNKPKSS